MSDFPLIKTERLRLRELTPQDAAVLFAIHGDAEAMKWFGTDPLTEPRQAEQLIELFASWRTSANPGVRWGIEDTATAALIGTCGFFKWNRGWRSCAIGFELAPSAQGRGLMKEAVYAAVQWAFQHMALNRIEALVHPDNTPSLNLLEKAGFVREGTLRQAGYWNGSHQDLVQLSLLRGECEYR
ncbi:GNAT family N-acetyltransferase [Pseudomonas sp. ADAK13]|uniref:GNAT family N-acetyltransferase n=1 Tax=Pseudomonas sp. ADAK13 TaxID=2730847 RepID=UPI0014639703|nr:GNAT family protein [Pseudomonas sp. ADAK13]QJI37166.1 GNAT family N-acetyltransferase [Pseudomonas sp. ADAK13]